MIDPDDFEALLCGGPARPRLVVTGGRDFADRALVDRTLSRLNPSIVIHGAARGADTLCAQWAVRNGVPVQAFPANWREEGPRAGFMRNQAMIDRGRPDAAAAFPGGKGTADMVRRLERAGVPIHHAQETPPRR